jgi:hypothetical protein
MSVPSTHSLSSFEDGATSVGEGPITRETIHAYA